MAEVSFKREIQVSDSDLEKMIRKFYSVPDNMEIKINSKDPLKEGNILSSVVTISISLKQEISDNQEVQERFSSFMRSITHRNGE